MTGSLGDSFTGLSILKNKIKTNSKHKNYFINKYYAPDLQIGFIKKLQNIATSSIDISDGLFADLKKLINKQKVSYKVFFNKIPISKELSKLLISKNLKKINFISRGDDYQILFTSPKYKSNQLYTFSKKNKIRITKIGTIIDKNIHL